MKTLYAVLCTVLLVACGKNGEPPKCASSDTHSNFMNTQAYFKGIEDVTGLALFSCTVNVSNVCIYQNVDINVRVALKTGANVQSVQAWTQVQNSTDLPIPITATSSDFSGSFSLNLLQGFNVNPGYFSILVNIYIPASTAADAQQKYASYISFIDVTTTFKEPG